MHSVKHWMSILFGLILIALGVLPLLSILGTIGISFDTWLGKVVSIFAYIVAFAGIYLIIDSFHEIGSMTPIVGWITLLFGFLVLIFGVVQLLVQWSVLGWEWWPAIHPIFYYAIFILEGILLFIAGFLT